MGMGPRLEFRQTQSLVMTPQLRQAIKLLQLPLLELQAQVQDALETNVMLEQEEDEGIDLASLEQAVPTGESETDGGEVESAGDADETPADEVVVEMEDPWAESSTPSGDGERCAKSAARPRLPSARAKPNSAT